MCVVCCEGYRIENRRELNCCPECERAFPPVSRALTRRRCYSSYALNTARSTLHIYRLKRTFFPDLQEPDVEGFDLWSPAAAGGRGDGDATRPSISDDGSVSPMDYGVRIAAAADDKPEQLQRETEAEHLRRTIESLEQANSALREELVEARLETTALRHTSVAHEEAVRDQERREALAQDEDQQQNLGGTGLRASEKPWLGGGGGEDEPLRADETEEKVEHELLEGLTCVDREGRCRRASDDLSRGGETKEPAMKSTTTTTTTATTTAPARLLRCQSSSAFKDNEEQAELIDALREQVSQLRLQAQRTRASRGSAGERGARHGQNCATRYGPHACDCNTGPLRNHLPCSSDDDSGSDPGKSDVISDHKARSSCPKCARKERDGCEESGGDGKRTTEGGNAESGGGSGQADDPLTTFVLRERVSELSAELEAATRALDALRRRVEQEQAANLELQREILRLHVARHNGTQMSGEVARVSARASWPGPIHRTVYPDHGGGNSDGGGGDSGGQGSENPIDCLKSHGMSWLTWLWRMFLGVREEDGTASGIEDRRFAGDVEVEESGVDVRSVGRGREGNFVGGDDGGGENEGAWGHGDGRGIGGTRRSSTDERASFLNNEERKMV